MFLPPKNEFNRSCALLSSALQASVDIIRECCEPIGKNRDVESPQGGIWTARGEMKPAGVNRRAMCGRSLSANPQIFRGRFAPVIHLFIAHLSTLIEVAQAGSFHGRDVHKHVLAAVIKRIAIVHPSEPSSGLATSR